MANEERTFTIKTGMEVVDTQGESVGNLESILTETATGVSRFITVQSRILPVEAIQEVENENVKLAVSKDKLPEFPAREGTKIPTDEQIQQAYGVVGLTGPMGNPP